MLYIASAVRVASTQQLIRSRAEQLRLLFGCSLMKFESHTELQRLTGWVTSWPENCYWPSALLSVRRSIRTQPNEARSTKEQRLMDNLPFALSRARNCNEVHSSIIAFTNRKKIRVHQNILRRLFAVALQNHDLFSYSLFAAIR